MKKYLSSLFILLICHSVFAQKGLHVGVSGTFSSSWILKQNDYGILAPFSDPVVKKSELAYRYSWGWNIGGQVGFNFNKHWGIQAEVQFNSTGQSYRDNFTGPATIPEGTFGQGGRVDVTRDVRLTYLQVPLMAKFMAGTKKIKFFIAIGPQVGLRTSAKEKVTIAGYDYVPDSETGNKFQTIDIGAAAQTGVQLFFTKQIYMEAALSSYWGLLDINGNAVQGYYSKNEQRYKKSYNFRAGLMVGIHYLIVFKQKIYLPND